MKLCVIYKTAPLYREAVFSEMDSEFDCVWYFGRTTDDIKEMDVTRLKDYHYYKTYGNIEKCYWQHGIIKLLFKKEYNIYLILAETRCVSTWVFLFLNLFIGKKVYAWSHGWYGKESIFERFLKRCLFKMFNGTFLYGEYSKKIMIQQGFPSRDIFVIHNSLDYKKQLKLRNNLKSSDLFTKHFKNSYPVIVMIGRLNFRKRLDLLIDALNLLMYQGDYFNLVFIGEGEDRNKLVNLVREKKIEDYVWFYGACYDEKTNAELLYNSDLCVVPGDIGLTAIHSLMFGVPVITHNAFMYQGPEFEAIKPGITGDFFEYNSAKNLALKIKEWFDSNKERNTVRKNCFKEIDEKWTPNYQLTVLKENIRI